MKQASVMGALLVVVTFLVVAQSGWCDGILVPPFRPEVPYFSIKYHHVKVEIEDQVSTTHVDQVFVNETNREQEATYIFPLPLGAVVKDFALIVDGKKMEGEMLPREKAVGIYEEIVRKRRDPALLEYTGRGMYKARIYPIPPHGERRIEINYTEMLPYDNGLVAYSYPMGTEKFSKEPIRETVFEAKLTAKTKIGTVYSPSHEVEIVTKGREATVSYEEKKTKPDRDLLLYYTLAQSEVGTSVLTFKEKGEDGYFLLLASPPAGELANDRAAPKNVIFVLDRSGSMAGEKIEQARKALKFCVESLNPNDQFDIITFASTITSFGDGLKLADREQIEKARKFVAAIKASGGTDINGALKAALETRKPGVPNYIAFLTDGLPTVGEVTDPDEIQKLVKQQAGKLKQTPTRLFAFGVGYDVDTHFLDKLTEDNSGLSTYVRPSEDIEVKVSNWYAKIAQPVLTELKLSFGSVKAYDMLPRELPDLFAGSQVSVLGRYKADSAGKTRVTLTGVSGDEKRSFGTEIEFPAAREGTDYVASLWASRKIGFLLDQIRLHGKNKELTDEIVALSTRFGILTEYTAFLATEDAPLAAPAAATRAAGGMSGAFEKREGGWATSQAENAQAMRQAATVAGQNRYRDQDGKSVQISNVQNRGQRGFVQRGAQWQDMRYDPSVHKATMKVQAYSEAYFQLNRAFAGANQLLTVSDNMIIVLNGQAVEIGAEGKTHLSADELKALGATDEQIKSGATG